MNTNNCKTLKRILGRILLAVMAAAWLSWTLPANAGTKTVVWVQETTLGVLWDGEWSFPAGRLHIQGHGGVNLIVSETPLLTGLNYWIGDLQWDAEGNGVMNGTFHLVVGDVSNIVYDGGNVVWGDDGVTPKGFVATGGIWEGNWHGLYQGNMVTMHANGKGIAGEVDGLTVRADMEQDRSTIPPQLEVDVITDPKAKK